MESNIRENKHNDEKKGKGSRYDQGTKKGIGKSTGNDREEKTDLQSDCEDSR